MSDAGAPEERKEELTRAVGGAVAEGAVAAHLHHDEAAKQSKDVQEQQLAEQVGARAMEKRTTYHNDPVRQPGLDHTVRSRHAQVGSHGLSGQGPK